MRATFDRLLDKTPDDWGVRGIFADWCEENGLPELGVAQRWMAANGKRPFVKGDELPAWMAGRFPGVMWGREENAYWGPIAPFCLLPDDLLAALPKDVFGFEKAAPWRIYRTRRKAEAALAGVLGGWLRGGGG